MVESKQKLYGRLVALIISSLYLMMAYPQTKDLYARVWNDVPKERLTEREDVSMRVSSYNILYEWNASDLFRLWRSDGFSLYSKEGKTLYATGVYSSGSTANAVSPAVRLPTASFEERIYVSINHEVEVEDYYDEAQLYVSEDNGRSYFKIYAFSGKLKSGFPTGIDLTRYAGKSIRLKIALSSDENVEYTGWSITSLSIRKGIIGSGLKNGGNGQRKSVSRNGETELSLELTKVDIKDDGTGEADFLLSDTSYYNELQRRQDEFFMYVNGAKVGNLEFSRTPDREYVNVVYTIDNSGSMGTYQEKVKSTVPQLIRAMRDKFTFNAALIRFGQQGSNGCSVVESIPEMEGIRNTIVIDSDGRLGIFIGNETLEGLWSHNVQNGYLEQYYAVLKTAAETPFTKIEDKLLVVVLMGDEPEFNGENEGDCDHGGGTHTRSSQTGIADYLKSKGVMTFVIQKRSNESEYAEIIEKTNGAFVDIDQSNYNEIAEAIGARLRYTYHVKFRIPDNYECGQTVLVGAEWDSLSTTGTTEVRPRVSVRRTMETESLERVRPNTRQTLAFDVYASGNCGITADRAVIRYAHEGETEEVTLLVIDGSVSLVLPAEHVRGEKIVYSLQLEVSENGRQIGSPYVTHSDWTWEFGIDNDCPRFSSDRVNDNRPCRERIFSIEITDEDGIAEATLHYRSNESAAYENTPLIHGQGDTYSAELASTVGDAKGFDYYVTAKDSMGLEANFGEAPQPRHMEFESEYSVGSRSTQIEFNDNGSGECHEPGIGEDGTFYYYIENGCGDKEKIYEKHLNGGGNNETMDVPNIQPPYPQLYVKFSYDEEREIELPVGKYHGGNLDVCIPDIPKTFEAEGVVPPVHPSPFRISYGDTVRMNRQSTNLTLTYTNPYHTPIVVNEVFVGGSHYDVSYVANELLRKGESGTISFTYDATSDEISEVRMYNSTRQNPFVFYLEGTSEETTGGDLDDCDEKVRSVSVNPWGTMVEVYVGTNNESVSLAVYSMDGTPTQVGFGPQTMNGPTTHNLYLGTSVLPQGTYVLRATMGDNVCTRRFMNVK